jgi:hypothetical protein
MSRAGNVAQHQKRIASTAIQKTMMSNLMKKSLIGLKKPKSKKHFFFKEALLAVTPAHDRLLRLLLVRHHTYPSSIVLPQI